MKPFVIATLIVTAASASVSADILYPAAIVLEPGYASGTPFDFPWGVYPEPGDPIVIVARVAGVHAPFDDLLPAGTHEITCVFEGASCTSGGMWDDIPCAGGSFGTFEDGTLAFYLDTTPDGDFADPATFRDGELVLLAQTTHIHVADNDPYAACPFREDEPDVVAYFSFSGGTWFPRVSDNGTGLAGNSVGEILNLPPAELQALGYTFQVDGTFDVYGPVATEQTTWGAVKAMYR